MKGRIRLSVEPPTYLNIRFILDFRENILMFVEK